LLLGLREDRRARGIGWVVILWGHMPVGRGPAGPRCPNDYRLDEKVGRSPNIHPIVDMAQTFKKYLLPERTGFHCLTIYDLPKSRPQFGQILVRVKAVSLNWRDCAIAKGIYAFPGESCNVPCSDGAGNYNPFLRSIVLSSINS
jgi:hypothetical protein